MKEFDNIDDSHNYLVNKIKEEGYQIQDERNDTVTSIPFITIKFKNFMKNYQNIFWVDYPKSSILNESGLQEYAQQLQNKEKGTFCYTYGNRFRAYFGYDQFLILIDKLKNNKNSRRAVSYTYDVKNDSFNEEIPCLQMIQLQIYDNKLFMTVYFRSNDITFAYSSNMYGLMELYKFFMKELHLDLGELYYVCSNPHIKEV